MGDSASAALDAFGGGASDIGQAASDIGGGATDFLGGGAQDIFGLDPSQAIGAGADLAGGAADFAGNATDFGGAVSDLGLLGGAFDPSQFGSVELLSGTDAAGQGIDAAEQQITQNLNLDQLANNGSLGAAPAVADPTSATANLAGPVNAAGTVAGPATSAAAAGLPPGDLGGGDIMKQVAGNANSGGGIPPGFTPGGQDTPMMNLPGTDPGFFKTDIAGLGITPKDLLQLGIPIGALGAAAAMRPDLPNPNTITPQLQTNAAALNKAATPNLNTAIQGQVQGDLLSRAAGNIDTSPNLAIAGNLAATGKQNTDALNTGQLPPGARTAIDSAAQSAKATVKSHFASMGLAGSSMEAGALTQVDEAAASQTFSMAQQLSQLGLAQLQAGAQVGGQVNQLGFQEEATAGGLQNSVNALGLNEAQLSNQIYQQILQQVLQSDQNFSNAVTNFAGALGGAGTQRRAA